MAKGAGAQGSKMFTKLHFINNNQLLLPKPFYSAKIRQNVSLKTMVNVCNHSEDLALLGVL